MILESIHEQLIETLKSRTLALFGHAVDRVVLQAPPKLNMGDRATPIALELAKALKRKPREIAEQLANGMTLPPLVASVSVEGAGYLNFRFDRGAFTAEHFRNVMASPRPSGERVIVEHTNINPNKAAHIGHLRNSVLGDTYVRCSKWLGDHVETQNYIDDTGVQVADVVVAFERLEKKSLAEIEELARQERFDYLCWDVYSKMAQYYADHPEAKEWRRETLHRIENQEGETAQLARVIARAVVRRHLETMRRLGITYDLLPKESDIIHLHFWDRAFELLKEKGALVLEEEGKHKGCWVMKLEESEEFSGMNEPDKILVRSNGTVTYTGKDIAYQLWKLGFLDRTFQYRKFPFEYVLWETTHENDGDASAPKFGGATRVVNVIDSRQAYLQKVVKEGVRQVAGEKAAHASIHFAYEMVALTPATAKQLGMEISDVDAQRAYVEMSGRKGFGVKADDLLDALEQKATEAVKASRSGGAAAASAAGAEAAPEAGAAPLDAETLGRQIAIAALRYFMLRFGRNKVIAFDFDEALRFEGDSGPYLQYSTVRVQNIFRKMAERGVEARIDERAVDDLTLHQGLTDDMWELVRLSAELPAAIRRAVDSLELSVVTQYLLDLAQKFSSFYHKYPIMNEKDDAERQRRAVCAEVFRRTMVAALDLLGIPVPERM
ncbi:MAG TPA: arginine--tRNA ligase [Thermoanaerobaculia bacterium]|nr:arginine--tRNA ligase [Thermoanaerobaculia bacterium]